MLHIGFLSPEYAGAATPQGGLAAYLRKIGAELTRRGHRVSVICISKRNASWKDGDVNVNEVRRFAFHWRLHRANWLVGLLPVLEQMISCKRLERAVWKTHGLDPLHVLQASSYKAPGYTLLHNGRIPIVCRVSSYTPLWRSACGLRRGLGELLTDWLETRQVLDAHAAFAPSILMANTFARLEGFTPAIIRTPIARLDAGSFDPSFFQSHLEGAEYLLFFGALNQVKGVDLLARALPKLLAKHAALKVVLIGPDTTLPNGQKMSECVIESVQPKTNRILYFPPLPKEQLYPVITAARGVVLPSRVDNYPNSCLESLSMGVPVVGTYGSSLEEIISDGRTGFLARNDDPQSLLEAVERLLALDGDEMRHMRDLIDSEIRRIAAEDRVGQLIDFYEAVVNRASA